MTPAIFLPRPVILFAILCTIIIPVHGQGNNGLTDNKKLYDELAYQDSALFSVVYTCQNEKVSKFIADDFEFYHDKGGPTIGKDKFLEQLKNNFCGPDAVQLRRELVKGSLKVYPMDNYGAIQMGVHRF